MSKVVPPSRLGRVAVVLACMALAGAVAVPAVGAASPAPTSPVGTGSGAGSSESAGANVRLERFIARHPLLAGTVRADFTVVKRDGATVLVHYETGTISAIRPTSISITGRDGKGAAFVVTDATRVRRDGHPISISALKVGDRALVFGTNASGTYTAVLIRSPKAIAAG
jgi:hypothetical protein